jgi:hypothetical protein
MNKTQTRIGFLEGRRGINVTTGLVLLAAGGVARSSQNPLGMVLAPTVPAAKIPASAGFI